MLCRKRSNSAPGRNDRLVDEERVRSELGPIRLGPRTVVASGEPVLPADRDLRSTASTLLPDRLVDHANHLDAQGWSRRRHRLPDKASASDLRK